MHSRSRRDAGTRPPSIPDARARVLQNGWPASVDCDFANNPLRESGQFWRKPWASSECARIQAFNVNRCGSIAAADVRDTDASRHAFLRFPWNHFEPGPIARPSGTLDRGGQHGRKGAFGSSRIAPRAAPLRAAAFPRKHLIMLYKSFRNACYTGARRSWEAERMSRAVPRLEDQASG
jgi:hypothetical protein